MHLASSTSPHLVALERANRDRLHLRQKHKPTFQCEECRTFMRTDEEQQHHLKHGCEYFEHSNYRSNKNGRDRILDSWGIKADEIYKVLYPDEVHSGSPMIDLKSENHSKEEVQQLNKEHALHTQVTRRMFTRKPLEKFAYETLPHLIKTSIKSLSGARKLEIRDKDVPVLVETLENCLSSTFDNFERLKIEDDHTEMQEGQNRPSKKRKSSVVDQFEMQLSAEIDVTTSETSKQDPLYKDVFPQQYVASHDLSKTVSCDCSCHLLCADGKISFMTSSREAITDIQNQSLAPAPTANFATLIRWPPTVSTK